MLIQRRETHQLNGESPSIRFDGDKKRITAPTASLMHSIMHSIMHHSRPRLVLLSLVIAMLVLALLYMAFSNGRSFGSIANRVLTKIGIRFGKEVHVIRSALSHFFPSRPYDASSYPKSGRTWLRLMLGYTIVQHFGLEYEVSSPGCLRQSFLVYLLIFAL